MLLEMEMKEKLEKLYELVFYIQVRFRSRYTVIKSKLMALVMYWDQQLL